MKKNRIILLSTGGTIEKTYNEKDGSLRNQGTVIEKVILPRLRLPALDWEVRAIMSKDSTDITEPEREMIVQRIADALKEGAPVLVIHGTDTMVETARLAKQRLDKPSHPVIFTGAMKPMEFQDSDAYQNVTEAVCLSQVVTPGVYISFHGQLFLADKVRKNYKDLTFEPLESLIPIKE